LIWPSEQQRTASISTSNTFLFSITACFRRASAASQTRERRERFVGMAGVEIGQARQLRPLFFFGLASQLFHGASVATLLLASILLITLDTRWNA
jgi:hypothetical protein